MSFRFDKYAIDDERGVTIYQDFSYGSRSGRAYPYIFEQGKVKFGFDVVFVDGKVPFINQAGERKGMADVTFLAGILEDKFSMGVARARDAAGLPPCTSEEYQTYKQIAIEGMIAKITRGGQILYYAPVPEVLFITSETDFLMKHIDITHKVHQE